MGWRSIRIYKENYLVVLVVCVIVFANTLLTGTLFSGAVVPADAHIMAADLTAFGNPASAISEK